MLRHRARPSRRGGRVLDIDSLAASLGAPEDRARALLERERFQTSLASETRLKRACVFGRGVTSCTLRMNRLPLNENWPLHPIWRWWLPKVLGLSFKSLINHFGMNYC